MADTESTAIIHYKYSHILLQLLTFQEYLCRDQSAIAKPRGSTVTSMTESQKASSGQVPGPAVLALRWCLLGVMGGLFLAWNFFWWARPTVWFGTNLLNKQWKLELDSGYLDQYGELCAL